MITEKDGEDVDWIHLAQTGSLMKLLFSQKMPRPADKLSAPHEEHYNILDQNASNILRIIEVYLSISDTTKVANERNFVAVSESFELGLQSIYKECSI